jgi:hypothetical protein
MLFNSASLGMLENTKENRPTKDAVPDVTYTSVPFATKGATSIKVN